jgi:hypothetical protein
LQSMAVRLRGGVVIPIVPSMHVAKTVTSAHAAACLCLAFSLQQTQ